MVVNDPLAFGLGRQWDLFTNDPNLRQEFFRTREDARAWLVREREHAGGGETARGA